MSKRDNPFRDAGWRKKQLKLLQARASSSEKLQRALDQLTRDLAATQGSIDPVEGGENMLALLISESHAGVDISKKYQNSYALLQNDKHLWQVFLDMLELLELEEEKALIPPQKDLPHNLDFLRKDEPQFERLFHSETDWLLRWRQSIASLQKLFAPEELAFRERSPLSETATVVLIRDEIDLDRGNVTVTLEATATEESDQHLTLLFSVALTEIQTKDASLFASIHWGDYREEMPVGESFRVIFPPVSLELIMDLTSKQVSNELDLELRMA